MTYRTPECMAYENAKARCCNANHPRWKDYGGRGIKFLFESIAQFMTELGPRPTPEHSLDRINNDGDYAPGNVRWATKSEELVSEVMTALGRRGGQSRSEAKIKAGRANLALARAARRGIQPPVEKSDRKSPTQPQLLFAGRKQE
jgi:hypothetical protein